MPNGRLDQGDLRTMPLMRLRQLVATGREEALRHGPFQAKESFGGVMAQKENDWTDARMAGVLALEELLAQREQADAAVRSWPEPHPDWDDREAVSAWIDARLEENHKKLESSMLGATAHKAKVNAMSWPDDPMPKCAHEKCQRERIIIFTTCGECWEWGQYHKGHCHCGEAPLDTSGGHGFCMLPAEIEAIRKDADVAFAAAMGSADNDAVRDSFLGPQSRLSQLKQDHAEGPSGIFGTIASTAKESIQMRYEDERKHWLWAASKGIVNA